MKKYNILEKYAEIITTSKINEAVTFDIPNPFKIRTQTENTITSIFSESDVKNQIKKTAVYANQLYDLLGQSQEKLLTTFSGTWSEKEIELFLKSIRYVPDKYHE